ncbi:organic solvent tolerance protein [Aliarcobacter cryaerophilus ATCC 43158]|uniref:Lipooligosaccharide transport system, OM translocon component LptD n=1 Tax=Aliarcobacter cryaerophilus ATCC 43158 TaxID=1032070 RepID=A0AAD0TSI6_9BACT|nr:LPS assembly protein LptD [Aliarcobacter cryaerophilus]AYJ80101.1 lipooligosaccharide transport system, OM translocon component LptD [Aliarcobacter cryaerophilus ATCC 43158]PRM97713.1 organic solvent tolerance protein [Aliarcobacter cryaerophilus]QCZ24324.1 organic solvent tolerance protein [Aliarcobacter cryaerophilus ATCC 43158]
MHKIVISLALASFLIQVNAQELNMEKLQLVAKDVDTKNNIITAIGDVVAYSATYYLSSDKMVYDKEKEILELFDNVLIIKDNKIQTQSNYAYVDMKNDIINQDPVFLMDNTSNIWSNSKEANKDKDVITLENSILSSCDCIDPIWSIRSSSSDYDTEAMWMNTYNPRLYVKNVPVFYLPYFGFPTDTTRRTGLLLPTMGYSSSEGFLYSQPIFIAPADDYDIELIPQIRTQRGYGSYANFRYADSPDSMLNVKTGYFKEFDNYRKEEKLENSEHYGLDIDYERKNIFATKKEHQDGVFTSIRYLNDIEYITLKEQEDNLGTDKKVESKINYFYNTPEYYGGVYGKYYVDASRKTNDNTLQELPQIQLHSYNKELFLENLIYSIDTKAQNFTRKEGLNAKIYDITVPISYTKNILDDYMYLGVENKTILTQYDYSNSLYNNLRYENGTLIQNTTSFIVGTDLIKPYNDYIHTLNLNASYDVPENIRKDGDLYNITVKENQPLKYDELSVFPTLQSQKTIKLSLNQSIYDKDNLKQFINHKMSQSILYNSFDEPKFQDLDNYVKINHDYGSISGKVVYNMNDNKVVEGSFDNSLSYEDLTFSAGYYYTKKTDNEFNTRDDLESYRLSTSYKLAKDYSIKYYENYDLQEKTRNRQGIGLNIDDSCWNLDLLLEKEITPRSRYVESTRSYDSHEQTIVYAVLMLKPIGGIRQKSIVKDSDK